MKNGVSTKIYYVLHFNMRGVPEAMKYKVSIKHDIKKPTHIYPLLMFSSEFASNLKRIIKFSPNIQI